jgi:hypothetical protein
MTSVHKRVSRRQSLKDIAGASLLAILGKGCIGGSLDPTGTGVRGLNTREQILSNPSVANLVDDVRSKGYSLSLHDGINPPIISGRYNMSGRVFIPYEYDLSPGTFRWYDQTSGNHISTDYNQSFGGGSSQSGSSSLGEIIRGDVYTGRFTVYSIIRVVTPDWGCDEVSVLLVDGQKKSNGDVHAIYISGPSNNFSSCYADTAGEIDLTLTGAAKPIVIPNQEQSAPLLAIKDHSH